MRRQLKTIIIYAAVTAVTVAGVMLSLIHILSREKSG